MSAVLEKEFKWYLEHQDELVKVYKGKFLVIKDDKVIGDYTSEWEAFEQASKNQKPGTFLIQKCEPGKGGYTATYHSRVMV